MKKKCLSTILSLHPYPMLRLNKLIFPRKRHLLDVALCAGKLNLSNLKTTCFDDQWMFKERKPLNTLKNCRNNNYNCRNKNHRGRNENKFAL